MSHNKLRFLVLLVGSVLYARFAEFGHFKFSVPHRLGFFQEIVEFLANGALDF